jgi:hypothetical protein
MMLVKNENGTVDLCRPVHVGMWPAGFRLERAALALFFPLFVHSLLAPASRKQVN